MVAYLGIDLGTSSVKVTAAEDEGQGLTTVDSWQEAYCFRDSSDQTANKESNNTCLHVEQPAANIFDALGKCLCQFMSTVQDRYHSKLKGVAVCGQMHGVILWSKGLYQMDNEYVGIF